MVTVSVPLIKATDIYLGGTTISETLITTAPLIMIAIPRKWYGLIFTPINIFSSNAVKKGLIAHIADGMPTLRPAFFA